MTIKNIITVPQNDNKFGLDARVNAIQIALHLFGLLSKKCIKHTNDPQNYIPNYEESVTGLNKLQNKFYEVFATMNNDIPEPNPYPCFNIESRSITNSPANIS